MRWLIVWLVLIVSCASPPKVKPVDSFHRKSQNDTVLYQRYHPLLRSHPGKSGISPLIGGHDALEARIVSVRDAEHTLDLQYYIWKNDPSGMRLLKQLIEAADRGVRVRLLLDNIYESRFHTGLKILDQHSNIEVRMVNPHFKFINYRMHNKAFIADNQVAIVGGRNIGDEYFDESKGTNFSDYDVLTIGPVVEEISNEFDQFWNAKSSFPIGGIDKNPIEERYLKKAYERLSEVKKEVSELDYEKKEFRPYWSEAHVVYDSPEKLQGKDKENLSMQLRPNITAAEKELILISPYFIPGEHGMKLLKSLIKRKVRIIVLTNSLGSTDVLSVYGGYRKYRKDLLKMGVELYEFRPSGQSKSKGRMGASSSTGLHGKVMIVDRKKMFVGSMNLDPRSKKLNTEMGVLLQNSLMPLESAEMFIRKLPEVAYRVEFHNNKLQWREHTAKGEILHKDEPNLTKWKNIKINFSSLIMPEELL